MLSTIGIILTVILFHDVPPFSRKPSAWPGAKILTWQLEHDTGQVHRRPLLVAHC